MQYPVGNTATAPALAPAPGTVEEPRAAVSAPARQVPLFDDRPKIIPFESITRRKASARRSTAIRREARAATEAGTGTHNGQQPLDLRSPAPRQKTAVSDDVPVAAPSVRLHAAMLDGLFLGVGLGLVGGTFYAMGGRVAIATQSILPCGVTIAAVAMFYHLFWSVLGRETAGMSILGLRTLTFDGHPPTWRQRVARFLWAGLGIVAVGIGALWALIDDEGLTAHDHISKTFPTEHDPNPSTVRRR